METTSMSGTTGVSVPSTKTILVTGATGDTGRPTVKLLLEKGHRVRALARKEDERSEKLRNYLKTSPSALKTRGQTGF